MRKYLLWSMVWGLIFSARVYGAGDIRIATLSEGSCWYENKEAIRIVSFNDKSVYNGNKAQIELEFEKLINDTLPKDDHIKINEMDLSLHCGGYGASLVSKVTTDGNTFCIWAQFDKGKLALRSLGTIGNEGRNQSEFCEGRKWGEFILGADSLDLISELQSAKWSSMIKSVTPITNKIYKVVLVKDYEFREQEVIDHLQENFTGKNLIRYIEFNEYRHPIGEFIHL